MNYTTIRLTKSLAKLVGKELGVSLVNTIFDYVKHRKYKSFIEQFIDCSTINILIDGSSIRSLDTKESILIITKLYVINKDGIMYLTEEYQRTYVDIVDTILIVLDTGTDNKITLFSVPNPDKKTIEMIRNIARQKRTCVPKLAQISKHPKLWS